MRRLFILAALCAPGLGLPALAGAVAPAIAPVDHLNAAHEPMLVGNHGGGQGRGNGPPPRERGKDNDRGKPGRGGPPADTGQPQGAKGPGRSSSDLNCPPGLAKKDPPCVPPGLARKGVTTSEWLAYGEDEYYENYEERRDAFLESVGDRPDDDPSPPDGPEVLTSEEIATLYGLTPAPEGQRYAVIDGLPLLLSDADYQTLEIITRIARVELPETAPDVAPDRTLGPDQIARLYKLPDPEAGETYAVVNGEVVALGAEAYEMLQLLRLARAAT